MSVPKGLVLKGNKPAAFKVSPISLFLCPVIKQLKLMCSQVGMTDKNYPQVEKKNKQTNSLEDMTNKRNLVGVL